MSKLGRLNASILVDGDSRVHYGPGTAVTGRVVLRYSPATSLFKKDNETGDLFGPIAIDVDLYGCTDIVVSRHRQTQHGSMLFQQKFHVYNGSFKAQVNHDYTFPFRATFPGQVGSGLSTTKERLPPTFAQHFVHEPDSINSKVYYRVKASAEMPGIDIHVSVPDADSRPHVEYDLPRPSMSSIQDQIGLFSHRTSIQSEHLLPESARPQGFKQKAKAVFASSSTLPTLDFDIFCTDHKHIYAGQNLTFDIRLIKHDQEATSSPASTIDFPTEMTLETFKAELRARTAVDVSSRIIASTKCQETKTVQTLTSQTRLPIAFDKERFVTVPTTGAVGSHPSSFEHSRIERTYKFRVSLGLKVASKMVRVVMECDVAMVPPPTEDGEEGGQVQGMDELPPPTIEDVEAEAGPSVRPSGSRNDVVDGDDDDENLPAPPPAYGETDSSNLKKDG